MTVALRMTRFQFLFMYFLCRFFSLSGQNPLPKTATIRHSDQSCTHDLTMKRSSTGHFLPITVGDQRVQSFIPLALPPTPGIDWTAALTLLFEEAMLALGRLESTYALVPMAQRLQVHLEKKEALASCVLEGAQVSLRDVFLQEVGLAGETPKDEVMRVLLAYEAM